MTTKADQKSQAIAEMWILGKWRMRLRLIHKLRKEEHLSCKLIASMILIACFSDICCMLYGRDWLIDVVRNKTMRR